MNRIHKIKLEKEYCDSVYYGDKTKESSGGYRWSLLEAEE